MQDLVHSSKIGILASPGRGPSDVYLANQVMGAFDVPLILIQKARRCAHAKRLRKLLRRGPAGMIDWWLNRRFEARRQAALAEELAARFAAIGGRAACDPGPRVVEVEDVHAPASIDLLRRAGVTMLLQNGAGILKSPLIQAFPGRILNVHHGWLPAIRGCHSIAWGLLENRPDWIGVSIHLIDEGLDTGPILAREHIPVAPGDTYASLFFAATVVGGRLLTQAIADLAAGRCTPVPRIEPGEYRPAMTRRGWVALPSTVGQATSGKPAVGGKQVVDRPNPDAYHESACPTPTP